MSASLTSPETVKALAEEERLHMQREAGPLLYSALNRLIVYATMSPPDEWLGAISQAHRALLIAEGLPPSPVKDERT